MKEAISEDKSRIRKGSGSALSLKEIEALKIKIPWQKKGLWQTSCSGLREVAPQEKPELGKVINECK